MLLMAEVSAVTTPESPKPDPADEPKTGRCHYVKCKKTFTFKGRDVHKLYCDAKCRKAAWMHRFALRAADAIIKRRERLRAKKAKGGKR